MSQHDLLPASWRVKMVERIWRSSRKQREDWIRKANYNLVGLESDQVFIDLLTDSGTGAMSDRQWAALMIGDETYAGSSSFSRFRDKVEQLFGFKYVLPVHQGRAAEHVLFSRIVERNNVGNLDIQKLEDILAAQPNNVPFVLVTVTCNKTGGQLVSIGNMRRVKALARAYGVPVVFDSAQFSENAWFIQQREPGYAEKTIEEIIAQMYQYADAMIMRGKKDGMVNIGGFLAMRGRDWFERTSENVIPFEGYTKYGGMAGRDMEALAVGRGEATCADHLRSQVGQVQRLGRKPIDAKIPIQQPVGGHAIVIDAAAFLPLVPREEFVAQILAVELYLESGVRGVEIGTLMNDRDPITGHNRYARAEFMRLAIPRRVYGNDQLDVVAKAFIDIYGRRLTISRGLRIVKEADTLRHFTVILERAEDY
ncbi:hypothetical protein LRP88_14368 [Fusarium phalaenopsidis]